MNASILVAFVATSFPAVPIAAQPRTCGGLDTVKETVSPLYPPIARAAQLQGVVIVMTSFRPDGVVSSAELLSGPKLLQTSAMRYVQGLLANTFTGPRTCAIVVRYELDEKGSSVDHIDPQHVVIRDHRLIISDPPM